MKYDTYIVEIGTEIYINIQMLEIHPEFPKRLSSSAVYEPVPSTCQAYILYSMCLHTKL